MGTHRLEVIGETPIRIEHTRDNWRRGSKAYYERRKEELKRIRAMRSKCKKKGCEKEFDIYTKQILKRLAALNEGQDRITMLDQLLGIWGRTWRVK